MSAHGHIIRYDDETTIMSGACVIGFEAEQDFEDNQDPAGAHLTQGWVFGDGMVDVDYGARYIACTNASKETETLDGAGRLARGPTIMAETALHSLKLRLNFPYLLIHQGNCQHYFVLDQIRLRQKEDPLPSQFPLTTFMPTTQRPSCRICVKWPAALSVVGDTRLGETPSLVCTRCWEVLGAPPDGENVLVTPMTTGEMA